jgi:hypothetical protein
MNPFVNAMLCVMRLKGCNAKKSFLLGCDGLIPSSILGQATLEANFHQGCPPNNQGKKEMSNPCPAWSRPHGATRCERLAGTAIARSVTLRRTTAPVLIAPTCTTIALGECIVAGLVPLTVFCPIRLGRRGARGARSLIAAQRFIGHVAPFHVANLGGRAVAKSLGTVAGSGRKSGTGLYASASIGPGTARLYTIVTSRQGLAFGWVATGAGLCAADPIEIATAHPTIGQIFAVTHCGCIPLARAGSIRFQSG